MMNGLVRKMVQHAAEQHAVAMIQEISLHKEMSEEYEEFLEQHLYYRFFGDMEAYYASITKRQML